MFRDGEIKIKQKKDGTKKYSSGTTKELYTLNKSYKLVLTIIFN